MSRPDESTPRRIDALEGKVVLRPYGRGSKSERVALMLDTERGPLLLRRRGGPSFGETGLESWVGKLVVCWGTRVGQVLLVDRLEPKS
jgi:hypothetical protein